jgi:hypothetical protein
MQSDPGCFHAGNKEFVNLLIRDHRAYNMTAREGK